MGLQPVGSLPRSPAKRDDARVALQEAQAWERIWLTIFSWHLKNRVTLERDGCTFWKYFLLGGGAGAEWQRSVSSNVASLQTLMASKADGVHSEMASVLQFLHCGGCAYATPQFRRRANENDPGRHLKGGRMMFDARKREVLGWCSSLAGLSQRHRRI